jgi:hypothetical protein
MARSVQSSGCLDTPKARMFAYLKQKSCSMSPVHVPVQKSQPIPSSPLHFPESNSFLACFQSSPKIRLDDKPSSSRPITMGLRRAQISENSELVLPKKTTESLHGRKDCNQVDAEKVFTSSSCYSGNRIMQGEAFTFT